MQNLKLFSLVFFVNLPSFSYGMKNSAAMELCPITIYDTFVKPSQKVPRTVWHSKNTNILEVGYGLFRCSPKTIVADDEVHTIVANMQYKATIFDKPCIVFEDASLLEAFAFTRPEFEPFYTITAHPSYLYHKNTKIRDQLLGHELGHHVAHKSKNGRKEDIYTSYKRVAELRVSTLFAIYFTSISGGIYNAPFVQHLYNELAGAASITQQEELFCDKFSVEVLGNTDIEKKELAEAAITRIQDHWSPILIAYVEFDNFLSPHTHPTPYARIQQFSRLAQKYSKNIQAKL